ncbi:hypothetical protein ABIC08_008466 [Bradyrhizobium sp. RT9b]|uniref:hypothetical protein n=1 Tax=Bradyrhizobium sp. RT9b TaxID=3156385 RepID=UPI00339631BC
MTQHFSDGNERTRLGGTFVQPNQIFLVAIIVRKNTEKFSLLTAAAAARGQAIEKSGAHS